MSNEESAKEVGEGESKGGGGQQATQQTSNSEPPQSSSSDGNHQENIKKNSILRVAAHLLRIIHESEPLMI